MVKPKIFLNQHNLSFSSRIIKKNELKNYLLNWFSQKHWTHFIEKETLSWLLFNRYNLEHVTQSSIIEIAQTHFDVIQWPILFYDSDFVVGYNEHEYSRLIKRMKKNLASRFEQKVVDCAKQLVSFPSVTPDATQCQQMIIEQMKPFGFEPQHLKFGKVNNLWLRHGTKQPLFVFAGHTDVVPPGDMDQWKSPPFVPYIDQKGVFYGRGIADMKGSIAAMLLACQQFLSVHQNAIKGSIAFLITGDEEGEAIDGTKKVVEHLKANNIAIDYCLVGEPTSVLKIGDTIKPGRRGSLTAQLKIVGKQGHIAYPKLAQNPLLKVGEFLSKLQTIEWDQGNQYFQPTSCQAFSLNTSTHTSNVIPGAVDIGFNFRYSTETNDLIIKQRIAGLLEQLNIKYEINWRRSAQPFLSQPKKLCQVVGDVIENIAGYRPAINTHGGTSDARFIHHITDEILELGLSNANIHQLNEAVKVSDLKTLYQIYLGILKKLLL